jgi:hypothetical protein
MSQKEDLARKRALIIMQVRSGQITATEGARRLGVSRKTYYEWEKRGLEGLMEALENQDSGRPVPSVDIEKEELKRRNRELEQKLLMAEGQVSKSKSQLEYEKQQRILDRERRREERAKKKKT